MKLPSLINCLGMVALAMVLGGLLLCAAVIRGVASIAVRDSTSPS